MNKKDTVAIGLNKDSSILDNTYIFLNKKSDLNKTLYDKHPSMVNINWYGKNNNDLKKYIKNNDKLVNYSNGLLAFDINSIYGVSHAISINYYDSLDNAKSDKPKPLKKSKCIPSTMPNIDLQGKEPWSPKIIEGEDGNNPYKIKFISSPFYESKDVEQSNCDGPYDEKNWRCYANIQEPFNNTIKGLHNSRKWWASQYMDSRSFSNWYLREDCDGLTHKNDHYVCIDENCGLNNANSMEKLLDSANDFCKLNKEYCIVNNKGDTTDDIYKWSTYNKVNENTQFNYSDVFSCILNKNGQFANFESPGCVHNPNNGNIIDSINNDSILEIIFTDVDFE